MQTTLRIDDKLYRESKAAAARAGKTITRFIEDALIKVLAEMGQNGKKKENVRMSKEIAERNRMMEALLVRTAHFRKGAKPTREEMNER